MEITDKIRIYHIDCMDFLKTCKDNEFNLAICDVPYGIGAENHAGNKKNGWNQWKKKNWDNQTPSGVYFKELFRVSKNQIMWGGNYLTEHLPPSMGWIVWDKGQRDFSLADGEMAWTSFNKAMRIFDFSRSACIKSNNVGLDKFHPTAKPIELYKWCLEKYAKSGDKILDTHLGSGSIAIACHDYNFDLTACELDKDYYDAAMKRIDNHIRNNTKLSFDKPQENNFNQSSLF